MVNIKIHRGTSQIGGTITEIYTENTHIFIDFGSELTVNPEDSTDGNMIDMIKCAECDAVLFSHYHGDHIGLLENIPQKDIRGKEITLGIGKVARQVLVNIKKTLVNDATSEPKERQAHKDMLNLLQDNSRWLDFMDALTEGNEQSSNFDIGDFHITTIRVDHSAYDSYMFVIEAEGKCIVHTGDFRVHGRLGEHFFDKFRNFMQHKRVDALLIEGTMLGRLDEKVMTEKELQKEATRLLQQPENKYAYLICSSTNMESLASFHKAVLFSNKAKENAGNKDCKRAMYVNHYVKQQMDLFASAEPDVTWGFRKANPFEHLGRYNEALGMSQLEYMEENGFLILIGKGDGYKKYIEPFEKKNPLLIYSMWDGYVEDKEADTYDERWGAVYNSFERKVKLHTSGHAVKKDLEEMIAIVNPSQAIIPIHTEFKTSYEELDGVGNKVKALDDGDVFSLVGNTKEENMINNPDVNYNAYRVIQFLKNNYIFEYTFTEKELEKYGFLYSKIKWTSKPIVFASGENDNIIEVMAYGGCIGKIFLDDAGDRFLNDKEIEEVEEYAKYLSPIRVQDEYYKNRNNHYIYLPEKFIEKYSKKGRERIQMLIKGTNTASQLLLNKEYLDLMVCAAYVRYMHRTTKSMLDVSERSMQSMIARDNMDNPGMSNLIVIDLEYKRELAGKKPSVDFVVLDKNGDSFGLIEFKYQGKSMNPNDKNSLTEHFIDFKTMLLDKKEDIVDELISYTQKLLTYDIINDVDAEKTIVAIKEKLAKGKLQDILWCGFHFVDDKSKRTKRKINGNVVVMSMEERIKTDCKRQILDLFEEDILSNKLDVRYQHSDIRDSREIKMKEDIVVLKEV